jgi:voltage-gated potassium channel Kch
MESKGLQPQLAKKHLIVAGWNRRAAALIRNLTHAELDQKRDIVILASLDRDLPVQEFGFDDSCVSYVKGDARNRHDLDKANLAWAHGVIILAEEGPDPDGKAILTVLTIERYCREMQHHAQRKQNRNNNTVSEMVDGANRQHFLDAGADEVICGDELSQGLFLQSIRNPGVSQIMQEILTVTEKNDIHTVPVVRHSALLGKTFDQLLPLLREFGILLLAIRVGDPDSQGGEQLLSPSAKLSSEIVFTNPLTELERNYLVGEHDSLIVLGESDREIARALASRKM